MYSRSIALSACAAAMDEWAASLSCSRAALCAAAAADDGEVAEAEAEVAAVVVTVLVDSSLERRFLLFDFPFFPGWAGGAAGEESAAVTVTVTGELEVVGGEGGMRCWDDGTADSEG